MHSKQRNFLAVKALTFILCPFLFAALSSHAHANYTQISTGGGQTFCGLLNDGRVDCYFFSPSASGLEFPDPEQIYTKAIVAHEEFCGLTADGEMDCRSTKTTGIATPVVFENPVVDFDVDLGFACAIDNAGNLKCWGHDSGTSGFVPPVNTLFTDITVHGSNACGIRDTGVENEVYCFYYNSVDGVVEYTYSIPPVAQPLESIDLSRAFTSFDGRRFISRMCGIRNDGRAYCWTEQGSLIAEFENGPYTKLELALVGRRDSVYRWGACALSQVGEIDCMTTYSVDDSAPGAAREPTTERLPGLYTDFDLAGSTICTYDVNDQLACNFYRTNFSTPTTSSGLLAIIPVVNGEFEVPQLVIDGAESYGYANELFFSGTEPDGSAIRYGFDYDIEIFRDGELVALIGGSSWTDNDIERDRSYEYSARLVHRFGPVGELSNVATVVTGTSDEAPGETTEAEFVTPDVTVIRQNGTTGLRAEVYWYDVELFWERNYSGEIAYYEIRRDGEMIATSRGTSFVDFQSVRVKIGPAECS